MLRLKQVNREYILKHKEVPVLLFTLDEDYKLSEMGEVFNEKRLPFGLKYTGKSNAQYRQLSEWIEKRGLPHSRSDLVYIKRDLMARNSVELSVGSYALNLTDHYWVHKTDMDLKWKDVNFFDNPFREIINFDIAGVKDKEEIPVAPDLTVDGNLRKKWVIIKNERYLVKGSRYEEMQEPFNEVIASKIMDKLDFYHTEYNLIRNERDNTPLSICKCMVDNKTEFLTAQVVLDTELKEGRNEYSRFMDICGKNGIKNAKKYLDEMIFLDCIIGNTDRHTGNFGIIRNADTLEWLGTAPVFDNGNSLFHDIVSIDRIEQNIDSHCRWSGGTNFEKLKYTDYTQWYSETAGKEIYHIISSELQNNKRIKKDKLENLLQIVDLRLKKLEKLQ